MSSNPVPLQFGVEIEFLLKPKPTMNDALKAHGFKHEITTEGKETEAKRTNRAAIRTALAEFLLAADIEAGITTGDYQQWTPVDEPSLDERSEFWQCEIVSRILNTSLNWQREIRQVFAALHKVCDIHLTPGCSMHVHVSPFNTGKYSIDQVKRVLKGVAYYDAAMTRIMPADRKANTWALSNVQKFSGLKTAYDKVRQEGWPQLFDRFDKHKMTAHILHDMPDRYVAWNFFNLTAACGTIEFRRPPGVKTAAEANHWVAVALGFVANAIDVQDWNAVRQTNSYPSSSDLRLAITRGVQGLGPFSQGALGPMADVNKAPTVVPSSELARIEMKKEQKSKKMSVFAEKVSNSRPNTPVGA